MKFILLLHRYLGMAVGLVMTLWCLSGFVMLYKGYPKVTQEQRLAGLEPLDLSQRMDPTRLDLGLARLESFRIEMLAGRPVLRATQDGGDQLRDLASGAAVSAIPDRTALTVAMDFARGNSVRGVPQNLALLDKDQWTVEDAARSGPVYRIGLNDPGKTVVYVSRRSGEVVQVTSRGSRFWAWLGPVPHWLYPTILRQNARLWDAVVVWIALIGCFLTLTGIYVGVARLRRYAGGRWSPYRGWRYWHHIAGLLFGVMTLTWVASGLFTMNPWGFLDTSVGEAESVRLEGGVDPAALRRFLAAAPSLGKPGVVALDAAPLHSQLYVLERFGNGRAVRLDANGAPAALSKNELAQALTRLSGAPLADLTLLRRADAYYYAGYEHPAPLPVWRARTPSGQGKAYYLDATTGQMVLALDSTARASRWIRTGLHDLDFPGIRARPVWDVIVLVLLAGVTVSCATGAWLGLRRLAHDLRTLLSQR